MASGKARIGVLAVLGAVALGLVGWALFPKSSPPARAPAAPVTSVVTAPVEQRDFPVVLNALGQAQGWQTVTVRAEVSGRLLRVPVREGTEIPEGALIAEIDGAPFRAALMQAQGALRRDQAQLDLAKLKLQRFRQLADSQGIAALDVDTQSALVHQFEGAVMANEGAVAAAKVDLDNTRIVAPWPGRVGIRLVDAGNLVSASDSTGIVTLNQVSPIAVTFTLPQGEFQRLSRLSDGFRKPLRTEAYGQETDLLIDTGELVVVDNRVDPATATVQLKARFANAEHQLWPGQLLNVKLRLQTLDAAVTMPSIAVGQGPNGAFTYVVENDKAVLRPLEIELQQDATTVVKSGVRPGEAVVVEGQGSLRPDAKVTVRAQ